MTKETKERLLRRKDMQKKLLQKNPAVFTHLPKGLLIITLILIGLQVLISNVIGVKGAELVSLEEEKANLLHQQMMLENEISRLSSLQRIEKESKERLALVSVDKNILYSVTDTFASIR